MNNENQNLNSQGQNTNVVNPQTAVPTPSPVSNVTPVANPATGAVPNVVPQPEVTPNMASNPVPTPNAVPGTQVVGNVNPEPVINLQPEGVVVPEPVVEASQTIEPLMGTNLTADSGVNLGNPQPQMGVVNNGVVPPTNNIGTIGVPAPPPEQPIDEKKKKPKNNKILIIILVVVLILAVGFGIYYYLNSSKKSGITISIKISDTLELGADSFTGVITDYISVSGTSIGNCELTSNVDINAAGTYKWSVTCDSKSTGEQTVTVKDTTPPEVVTRDLIVVPDTVVSVDEFIVSILDASDITYAFEDEVDTSVEGTYEVNIIVSDAYENETSVTATLTVSEDAPVYYLYCENELDSENYSDVYIEVVYKYGINALDTLYNQIKTITYYFDDETEYNIALDSVSIDSFDGYEGTVTTDDDELTITIEIDISTSALADEFALSDFPTNELEIEDIHYERDDMCYIMNY